MTNRQLSVLLLACAICTTACTLETGEGTASDGDWVLHEEIDKFTDKESKTTYRVFASDSASVEVRIQCLKDDKLVYTFTSFTVDDEGLPFRSRTNINQYGFSAEIADFMLRIDSSRSSRVPLRLKDYNNQAKFSVHSSTKLYNNLLDASTLLIRLPLQNGDFDLEIDQTSSNIDKALQSCKLDRAGLDGRTMPKTHDTDSQEYGGAEPGMDYGEFRQRLVSAGFQPVTSKETSEICADDPTSQECTAYKYKETDSCSGTGEAFCNYTWAKGRNRYIVLTREGEGGQVVEMRFER